MPITWRNIQAPNLNQAGNLLESARRSLGSAISGVGQAFQAGQDRIEEGDRLTSNRFLEDVRRQYDSPEALQEAQASGQIDALRARYQGLDADRTGMGAIDGLVAKGREQAIATERFEGVRRAERTRNIDTERQRLIMTGDMVGLRALNDSGDFDGEGAAELAADNRGRTLIERDRNDYRFGQEQIDDRFQQYQRGRTVSANESADAAAARQTLNDQRAREYLGSAQAERNRYGSEVNQALETAATSGVNIDRWQDPAYIEELTARVAQPIDPNRDLDAQQQSVNAARTELQQLQELQQTLGQIDPALNNDAIREGLMNRMLADGTPLSEASATLSSFDAMQQAQLQGSAITNAARSEAFSKLATKPEYRNSSVVQELIQGPRPVAEVAASLREKHTGKVGIRGMDPEGFTALIDSVIGQQIEYAGQPITVTEAMLDEAIARTGDSWFRGGDPLDQLEKVISSGGFSADIQAGIAYEKEAQALQGRFPSVVAAPGAEAQQLLGYNVDLGLQQSDDRTGEIVAARLAQAARAQREAEDARNRTETDAARRARLDLLNSRAPIAESFPGAGSRQR